MAQELIQTQEQRQQMLQRLSSQQLLVVKLLEMPLAELEESIRNELDDNPALESIRTDDNEAESGTVTDASDDNDNPSEPDAPDDYDLENERQERADALDSALQEIGQDDQMPSTGNGQNTTQTADYEEMVYGDTTSFYDKLKEQMDMLVLTEQEKEVMEYLIGSLDDDGLLRKPLDSISDELAIYHNLDLSTTEILHVLEKLQSLDPAGIGARSLQECLLLQVRRRPTGVLRKAMEEVLTDHYKEFTRKHWHKIKQALELNDTQLQTLREEIQRLNPKPGASLGETEGRSLQQITPDFIVETQDDGTVTFSLNNSSLPSLSIDSSFTTLLDSFRNHEGPLNRQDKEAQLYARDKVSRAQGFIDAVKQRQQTLILTMKTIIQLQKPFFLDGDEAELRPMILKDVADRTGLDISTVSRVSNMKYAQTKWGIFPLRFFFSDTYTSESGEEMSVRKVKLALKDIIDKEDKGKPLSDELLTKMMEKQGYHIARRTVAKYREQMNIPVARLRRQ